MSQKWFLFAGIVLLALGIILKSVMQASIIPILLIVLGGLLKVIYIISLTRVKVYRPGFELVLLAIGLALFLSGNILRKQTCNPNFLYFMIPGIVLKAAFVFLFIRKIANLSKINND